MAVRPRFATQSGAGAVLNRSALSPVWAALALSCALLVGCVEELGGGGATPDAESALPEGGDEPERHADSQVDSATDAGIDGGRDAASRDTGQDATREDICVAHEQRIASFVQSHRSCASDDDCAIVGDCSHSNFQAVSRGAEAEARDLVLSDPCGWQDGPGYFASCRKGVCERVKSTVWCGSPVNTDCPAGTSYVTPGCDTSPNSLPAGCYTPCSGQGDDGPCTSGFTCQKADVHPCPSSPPGGATCAACSQEKWLCRPVAACQLELALTFDRYQARTVRGDEGTVMRLDLRNRTDQTLTFSFEQPCHGPTIVGLESYDVWDACLAGACATPTSRIELTLAPRELRTLRTSLIQPAPTQCNLQGLASGKYAPTFALPNVQGANVCGPAASALTVIK